jgi:hypothetical protein
VTGELKKISPFVNLKNLTLSRLFYYQALRIVERAVLPTALVIFENSYFTWKFIYFWMLTAPVIRKTTQ